MSRTDRSATPGGVGGLTRTALATIGAACLVGASTVPVHADIDPPQDPGDIDEIIAGMSEEELIGQMTWTHVYGDAADDDSMKDENQARYGVDTPAEVIEKYGLGGVLYFAWSNPVIADDPAGTAELSNGLQETSMADGSGIPLATTVDQEGGIVARIGEPATVLPGNMALGATFDADLAHDQGAVLGSEMAAMGINVDFAPSVDTNTNPNNPVIGLRSMGDDPQQVADLGMAQIDGMQEEGVASSAKHFPGHGDTETDSHSGLPIVTYDRATLDEHLIPFERAIDGGVDMVMTAHIIVEAIDADVPGTLSRNVLTGLLREEMGFDGLITTDALDMDALKEIPGHPLDDAGIAVETIQAGSDILLNSPDVDAAIEGVLEAVEDGEINRDRLEESVQRILQWKLDRGLWDDSEVDPDAAAATAGNDDHRATAATIAEQSITLLRNEDGVLPLDPDSDSVLLAAADPEGDPAEIAGLLRDRGFDVTEEPAEDEEAAVVAEGDDVDAVVVITDGASGDEDQQQRVQELADAGDPVVVLATGTPYDINALADADALINLYGSQPPSLVAGADAVAGDLNPSGRLPVNVPSADGEEILLERGFGLSYEVSVTPEAPTFTDEPGTEDDAVTVADVEGVQFLIDGDAVEPGTYPASGTVTVTAEPEEGFVFPEGATTKWRHTFEGAEDPEPDPSEEPTGEPTQEPSQEPSEEPTQEPSSSATQQPDGDLPETGADSSGYLGAATVLLIAGAAALVTRRRRLS